VRSTRQVQDDDANSDQEEDDTVGNDETVGEEEEDAVLTDCQRYELNRDLPLEHFLVSLN